MVLKINRIAKAVVAWAVPTATVLVSVGTEVTSVTDDGIVNGAEWQLLAVGVIAGFLAWWKSNAPPA